MLIVCPSCATAYEIALSALGDAGRAVRCARCKNAWFATPASAVAPASAEASPGDHARAPEPSIDDLPDEAVGNFIVDADIADDPDAAAPAPDTAVAVVDAPSIVPAVP